MAGEAGKKQPVSIAVQSKDNDPSKAKKPGQKKSQDEMTEEDKKLKQDIDLLVERVQDSDPGVVNLALQTLTTQLREAASSMTSVPKPLKFLRPHIEALISHFQKLPDSPAKESLAMILSVICTTCLDSRRLALHFCLLSGCREIVSWGYAYLRTLSGQISSAYSEIQIGETGPVMDVEDTTTVEKETTEKESKDNKTTAPKPNIEPPIKICPSLIVPLPSVQQLVDLVSLIVPFYVSHNAELDAVDLLAEVDHLPDIIVHLDQNNYQRVVQYILGLSQFASGGDEYHSMIQVAYKVLMGQQNYFDALRVALKINNQDLIKEVLDTCTDAEMTQQLAILLARQNVTYEFTDEKLIRLYSNEKQSRLFRLLAKELDVLEPKEPEDVYKTHLEDQSRRLRMAALDSATQNLASTFVNALVNAGFGTDKLMTVEGSNWIFKNKEHGMLSATASLGAICLWNIDAALALFDRHQYSPDANIKAGALLGFGVASCNIRHECDAALALLKDHMESPDISADAIISKLAATVGLGCAYAGTCREDVMELLTLIVLDGALPIECVGIASLSLGLCFVGSANKEAAEAILTAIIDRAMVEKGLEAPHGYFMSLGLGLLFLGTRDASEAVLLALQAIPSESFACASQMIVEGLAAAGSGDVLKVQRFLSVCGERRDAKYWSQKKQNKEAAENTESMNTQTDGVSTNDNPTTESQQPTDESATNADSGDADSSDNEDQEFDFDQAVAVLNVALVAISEDIGAGMCLRMMDHILQYGSIQQRRAVPLAVALHSPSNPRPGLIDLLSKLSHDSDAKVALNAIIAMGIVGAGTNHARIASLLRQLASYYGKDANALFVLRISQGLLHMGKGLLTINPIHSDRFLVNNVALGSLLVVIFTCMHMKETLLSKYHYLLYYLFPAIHPRWMITVVDSKDEELIAMASKPQEGTTTQLSEEKSIEKISVEKSTEAMETDDDKNDEDLTMVGVSVRVGEAVDTVGQVGRQPKTITSFQTHNSPVLLSFSDRVELTTDECIPLARVLEGVVILKKNPTPNTTPKE